MVAAPPFPGWIRTLILLLVCSGWAIFLGVSFLHGEQPSAFVWTIPGATYAALATTGGGGRRRIKVTLEDDESEAKKP